MDQDAMVVNLDGGWQYVGALAGQGFPVAVAFWARPSDEGRWKLYIATPAYRQDGPRAVYQRILTVLQSVPECGVDLFEVTAIEDTHPMALAAAELATKPAAAKPYRGITRFRDWSLGGVSVDGAYIYPPWEPAAGPVA